MHASHGTFLVIYATIGETCHASISSPLVPKVHPKWYVQVNGKQVCLGEDEDIAWEKYNALMARSGKAETHVSRVDVILSEFLGWTQRNLSERTYQSYRDFLRSFNDRFPGIKTNALKPRHVTTWLDEHDSWNRTTRAIAIRSIKRCFNWALAEGLIDNNPLATLRTPTTTPREVVISPDQWKRIFATVKDQAFKDFLLVLKNTGARPGEIRQMEAQHIHDGVVIYPKVNSKGKRYNRVIYPNKEAKAIIDRLAAKHPKVLTAVQNCGAGRPNFAALGW